MQVRKIKLNKKNISFIAFVTLLGGCSDMDSHATLNSSKALAMVNGDEISVNQLHAELNRAHLDNDVNASVKNKLLSKIIDRQLLVQEAIKLNLDRAPEVVEAVNSAKAQIYAQAYLTKKISRLLPPTDESITQYIDEHPEVFAHRKSFSTTDVMFSYDPAIMDLKLLQNSVSNIESLRKTLESKNIKYEIGTGSFSIEALPLDWAKKFKQANIGDLFFAHDNTKVIVKSISDISENPMNADEARDFATRVLSEDKKQKFITNEVTRLRKLSKINILDNKLVLSKDAVSNNTLDNHLTKPLGKP